jgi:cyclophilin family peptidyl-prolyl cis-trans isomerase
VKRVLLLSLAAGALGVGSSKGSDKAPVVLIETSLGNIKVELDAEKAPMTVKNFLDYVSEKFYDGTIFHRVKNAFVIQGGGFTPDLEQKKTKAPIKNEAANGLSNSRGTMAMARTNVPDSATSQFYINLRDNAALDKQFDPQHVGYCVFGRVIDGMDVVDKIGEVETTTKRSRTGMMADVPSQAVVIKSIRRVDKD